MKLHANAALTLRQRRRMVALVLEQGWSMPAAAAEFKTSTRTCSKWVSRFREASESGLLDRSSACVRVANRTDERRIQVIAGLRRLRFTGPEIADVLGMPLSTVSGILTRIGMGRLGRLGLEPAQRYERARPGELVHVDVKKMGRIVGGAGKRVTGVKRNPRRTRWDHHAGFSRSTSQSMTPPPGLRGSPRRGEGHDGERVLAPRAGVLRQPWHHRRTRDDRQRLGLSLNDPCAGLPRPGPPAPAHPATPTADQRQSRTLHPHHARRLGLRRALRHRTRTHRSP